MLWMAASMWADVTQAPLPAVAMTPVPSGLLRNSLWPGRSPPLIITRSGWTRPVTARPYLGSLSTTVWPPAMTPPASATLSAPPWKIRAMASRGNSLGKPATFSAKQHSTPHGVDVAHRVGGGHQPVDVRVVHDGREEVHGLDDRLLVVQPVHRGVIAPIQPHQEVGVPVRAEVLQDVV